MNHNKSHHQRLYSNRQKRKIIRRIEKGAKLVSKRNLIYAFGGGRGATRMMNPPQSGPWTDCSGYAQWLCQISGVHLDNYVGSTWSLAEEGEAGESPWFTLFITNESGEEHVIIRLRRRYLVTRKLFGDHRWIECGGSDNPKIGDGPRSSTPTLIGSGTSRSTGISRPCRP